jgi:hypothetical protein
LIYVLSWVNCAISLVKTICIEVVVEGGCIERVLCAQNGIRIRRWAFNSGSYVVAVGIRVAIEWCRLHFALFFAVSSWFNVVRDDADTIKLAHKPNLATDCFGCVYVYISRNANRLAKSKVPKEKVCVCT